ncbi:hypothetical protein Q4485_01410 [Granulosicoccaceae sp. 1_MG-2023]|nr:hypothetical protein [Granulosicoccaceae sp. 1_MG-2023]
MSTSDWRLLFSGLSILLTVGGFVPYVLGIIKGRVRPHMVSWLIWGTTTFLVFIAQLQDGAGIGAWPIGVSGLATLSVALLAYRYRADITVTRTDRLFLLLALSSLPVWYLTDNPLWAVVILTGADLLGFGPTYRQVWHRPWSESMVFFLLLGMRNVLVLLALEHYSVTTALFPAAIGLASFTLLGLLTLRRRTLAAT